MALNVKQKYPGTQGGAAQLYASDTRLSLRRREQVFTRLSKSYKENMDISSTSSSSSSSDEEIIVLLNEERRRKRRRYWILDTSHSYEKRRTWGVLLTGTRAENVSWVFSGYFRMSVSMCARQDCFVFERPQVVFYCNFSSSRYVSKSANLIGRIVFDASLQTKKTNPRR